MMHTSMCFKNLVQSDYLFPSQWPTQDSTSLPVSIRYQISNSIAHRLNLGNTIHTSIANTTIGINSTTQSQTCQHPVGQHQCQREAHSAPINTITGMKMLKINTLEIHTSPSTTETTQNSLTPFQLNLDPANKTLPPARQILVLVSHKGG